MPESYETREPLRRSRIMMMTGGQKLVLGCFSIYCATAVANSFISYKMLDKRIILETLKATSNQVK